MDNLKKDQINYRVSVGKNSIVVRFKKGSFHKTTSTAMGASFTPMETSILACAETTRRTAEA